MAWIQEIISVSFCDVGMSFNVTYKPLSLSIMVENTGKYVRNSLINTCELYVPTYENGYLEIKMNQEIYNKFKFPDTVTVIKVCRFE
jgi:hypothetical protein